MTKLEETLTRIIIWLEKNKPEVFREGLWDAISGNSQIEGTITGIRLSVHDEALPGYPTVECPTCCALRKATTRTTCQDPWHQVISIPDTPTGAR